MSQSNSAMAKATDGKEAVSAEGITEPRHLINMLHPQPPFV
eukprot:CAMPEP_0180503994 /NCGR_PEP_ID=MMETSP1036_2-20121128/46405_1 /TAXON_ID=632150 /ORGANISM="Azadinium spinosum, Strain 3D9" /LENGTH=40 /DNA_ID= /DNA_START= /DNA_END= /DNA_ORIENTATION=